MGPPPLAYIGLCNSIPFLFRFHFNIGEGGTGFLIQKKAVFMDSMFFEYLFKTLPNWIVALYIFLYLIGVYPHSKCFPVPSIQFIMKPGHSGQFYTPTLVEMGWRVSLFQLNQD